MDSRERAEQSDRGCCCKPGCGRVRRTRFDGGKNRIVGDGVDAVTFLSLSQQLAQSIRRRSLGMSHIPPPLTQPRSTPLAVPRLAVMIIVIIIPLSSFIVIVIVIPAALRLAF